MMGFGAQGTFLSGSHSRFFLTFCPSQTCLWLRSGLGRMHGTCGAQPNVKWLERQTCFFIFNLTASASATCIGQHLCVYRSITKIGSSSVILKKVLGGWGAIHQPHIQCFALTISMASSSTHSQSKGTQSKGPHGWTLLYVNQFRQDMALQPPFQCVFNGNQV